MILREHIKLLHALYYLPTLTKSFFPQEVTVWVFKEWGPDDNHGCTVANAIQGLRNVHCSFTQRRSASKGPCRVSPWSNCLAMPSPHIKSNLLESKKCLLWTPDQAIHKEWAPWTNISKGAWNMSSYNTNNHTIWLFCILTFYCQ